MLRDVLPRMAPAYVADARSTHIEELCDVDHRVPERAQFSHLADRMFGEFGLRIALASRLAPLRFAVGHIVSNGPDEEVIGIDAIGIIASVQDALAVRKLVTRCGDVGHARRKKRSLRGHVEVTTTTRLRGAEPRPAVVVSAHINVTLEPSNLLWSERPKRVAGFAHGLPNIARARRHLLRVVISSHSDLRLYRPAQQLSSAPSRRSPSQAFLDRLEGR